MKKSNGSLNKAFQTTNKNFWIDQAKEYGFDYKAVNFDAPAEDLEMYYLSQLISNGKIIGDIGCGNGRTTLELANKKNKSMFYGIDFVKEMIDIANKQKNLKNITNANFYNYSAISEDLKKELNIKFDQIFCKRLLINLRGKDKIKAVKNIHSLLKSKGIFVMIECFKEPLQKINKIRKILDLKEIKIRSLNEYLSEDFLGNIDKFFKVKAKIDFQSLYYFVSRIYNASLSKGDPDYFAPINKLSVDLIKNGINTAEGYSPEVIYVLEKK